MALARWDPFREFISMREAMDRLFDEAIGRTRRWTMGEGWIPVDVYETDDAIMVKACVCGASPDSLNISVTGDTLTIQAEVRPENVKPEQYHYRELHHGTLARTLTLPVPVDADQAHATFENGMLHLTLPKVPAVRAKRIPVEAPRQLVAAS